MVALQVIATIALVYSVYTMYQINKRAKQIEKEKDLTLKRSKDEEAQS